MPATDMKRAREKCYRLLACRPRTEREVRLKLAKAGFAEPVIDAVVDELVEKSLLDDASFARDWVKSRLGNKPVGASYLRAELRQKGVNGEIIDEVLADYDEETEFRAAVGLVSGKVATSRDGKVNWRRMAGFLNRRGFSGSVINRVYRAVAEDGRFDIS